MNSRLPEFYEFGLFRLDTGEHTLHRNGQIVPLTPKVFDLLRVLVQNHGRLVEKDDLLKEVWPDSFVEEGNLNRNISILRKVLGEDSSGGSYIETVPKRGYRFVGGVKKTARKGFGAIDTEPVDQNSQSKAPPNLLQFSAEKDVAPRKTLSVRRLLVLGGLVALALGTLLYVLIRRHTTDATWPEIKSLAVLPIQNLSGDPTQDYFADGMTEALITSLAQIRALRVISRTSVMQYKETRKPLLDIARELNVDAIVEGSVQQFAERVKITARLIHSPTERQLWTETYERDQRDVLALQSEIARAVVQEIQINLTPQEQMRLASARPVKPEAYDEYLRGRFYSNRHTKADNENAIVTLERSVAIDPTFASAHAELAQAYVWRFFLFTPGEKHWEEKAFVAVEKALSLDPDLAEVYLARGRLLWTPANHFPHEKAIQEYRRALTLNPNLDEAQNQLALIYNHIGAFDRALQELQKAVATNPSNAQARFRVGQTFLFQGKYEQALTALREVPREINPALVGHNTAMALLRLGRRDEAAAMLVELLRNSKDEGGVFSSVQALLAASASEKNKAEKEIKDAIEKGKGFGHFHHTAYHIACAYALMKKIEPAIKWLQAAAEDGFPCYSLFEYDPYLDNLRKDPRFVALIANLKERWVPYRGGL